MLPLLAAVLALAWVALLVAAPLLPAAPAALVYAGGSLICHQLAARSFHIGEAQLPVCARCLGLYVGCAAAATVSAARLAARSSRPRVRRGLPLTPPSLPLTPRSLVALAAVPTAITLGAEWTGIWRTAGSNMANNVRFAAGVPLGAAVAVVVIVALATLHCGECVPRPPTASSPPPSPT